ncbi:hypothetical protein [Methanohalobium sp.]|uniref:hypothetical protein n=1 Tax=Methanohalobium sp. TaxID=2837493 RepID=UPI0025CF233C|nr:hypothetical protein [Methanohalobium sp.]
MNKHEQDIPSHCINIAHSKHYAFRMHQFRFISRQRNQQTTTDNTSSILAKNNANLTDTEIESLENETKEPDRLIESMDIDENITFEGI